MPEHGTNEPSPLEVEGSTAGATGGGDLGERLAALTEMWQAKARRLEESLNAIPGVSATVTADVQGAVVDIQLTETD